MTILERHRTWTAFQGELSFEEFVDKKIPKILFKEAVNSDVKQAFEIIQKLLIHSYYEYLFIDVAVNKALQTFEMALKLRYKELNGGKEWKKATLYQLIPWFQKRHYFESDNKNFLHRIRKTRNYLSHPENHRFAGSVGFPWIQTVVELINDLYEDTELRVQRKALRDEMTKSIKAIVTNGARLIAHNYEELIYDVGIVLVNNKTTPCQFFIGLLPIFDESTLQKSPIILQLVDSQFGISNDELNFNTEGGQQVKLIRNVDPASVNFMTDWKSKLQQEKEFVFRHSEMLFEFEKEFIEIRRSF